MRHNVWGEKGHCAEREGLRGREGRPASAASPQRLADSRMMDRYPQCTGDMP